MTIDAELRVVYERVDGLLVVIGGHAEDREALAAVLLLHFDQNRDFASARLAPGAPEIHENNFPFEAR